MKSHYKTAAEPGRHAGLYNHDLYSSMKGYIKLFYGNYIVWFESTFEMKNLFSCYFYKFWTYYAEIMTWHVHIPHENSVAFCMPVNALEYDHCSGIDFPCRAEQENAVQVFGFSKITSFYSILAFTVNKICYFKIFCYAKLLGGIVPCCFVCLSLQLPMPDNARVNGCRLRIFFFFHKHLWEWQIIANL